MVNPYLSYNGIIKKLVSRYVYVDNPLLQEEPFASAIASWSTRGADAMAEMPLSMLSSVSRGEVASRLVQRALTRFGCNVAPAPLGTRVNGSSTGSHSTPSDFLVDGKRAECKSAMMTWNVVYKEWWVKFKEVQKTKHDVLYLAFFSPRTMHVFLYDHALRETAATTLTFHAKRNDPSVASAETLLVKNLAKWHGLTYVARYAFGPTDVERVRQIGMAAFADLGTWYYQPDDDEDEDEDDDDDGLVLSGTSEEAEEAEEDEEDDDE